MRTLIERTFVWTGGALFVASLALTGWLYAIVMARPRSAVDAAAVLPDLLLLTAFAVHHSLFARAGAKKALERVVPPSLIRSLYVWIASLLLIAVGWGWQPIGGTIYRATGMISVLLVIVQLCGVWLIARAARAIRVLELAGIEPPRPTDELQIAGIYAHVRHPLYLGWILAVDAVPHMTGDRVLFAALTTAYVLLAIPWEERSLAEEFGAAYDRYRARVRWRVIPYVY